MLFTASADTHGVARSDALHAVTEPIRVVVLSTDPYKELRIGFGKDGSPLEVVILFDSAVGEPLVIHAMPLRKSYYPLLPGNRREKKR